MQIRAVATNPPVDIKAAMASPHYRGVEHVLRRAKIDVDKQLTTGEFDAKLKASALSTIDKIALKGALSRAGLLI